MLKAEPGWSLEFTVQVDPGMAKQSRIVTRDRDGRPLPFPRKYTPQETVNFRDAVQRAAERAKKAAGWELPWDGPVSIAWTAVYPCPKSRWRKTTPRPREWHSGKRDWDNLAKPLMDALTRVVWVDDGQVALGQALKVVGAQGEPASLYVRVWDVSQIAVPAGPVELLAREVENKQPGLFALA